MATEKSTEKPTKKIRVPGLSISAGSDSFRRAGFTFGRKPIDIPLEKLNRAQLKLLSDERMLTIVEKDIEVDVEG